MVNECFLTQSYHVASEALEYITYKSWTTFMMFLMSSSHHLLSLKIKVLKGVFTLMPQKNHFGFPKNLSVNSFFPLV